jgi:hypothetical protein
VDADFTTLWDSGRIHAELASAIPADTDKPDALELRERLLADAGDWLDRAEQVRPGSLEVAQLRAWMASLSGQPEEASRLYQAIRKRSDCGPELREQVVLHEAKVWSIAGDDSRAIAVLDANPLVGIASVERRALRVRLLWRSGNQDEARVRAEELSAADDEQARLVGAALLEGMGDWEAAEAAYRRVDGDLLGYRLARLKLFEGQTDRAVELLESAIARGGPEVRSAFEDERSIWVERAGERLEELTPTEVPAAPATGH